MSTIDMEIVCNFQGTCKSCMASKLLRISHVAWLPCRKNNVLVNAPHPADEVLSEKWDRPYTREQAAFPAAWVQQAKFWPVTSRVDNVHGDRYLVASLPQDEPCQEVEVESATA